MSTTPPTNQHALHAQHTPHAQPFSAHAYREAMGPGSPNNPRRFTELFHHAFAVAPLMRQDPVWIVRCCV